MANVLLTLVEQCAGSDHAQINVQINTIDRGTYKLRVSETLQDPDEDEIVTILQGLIRLHKIGKTNAQVRNNLLAGLPIVV
jgi:hypothetical protein